MTEPNEKIKSELLAWSDAEPLTDDVKPPVTVCDDEQNYIFISYSHKDYKAVYCDLLELADAGTRFWYDNDLTPGRSWSSEVKAAIESQRCAGVIFYLSENFVLSDSILKEVKFALGKETGCAKSYFTVSLSQELPERLIEDSLKKSGLDAASLKARTDIFSEAFPNEKTNIIKTAPESNAHIDKVIDTLRRQFNVVSELSPFYDRKEMRRRLALANSFAIKDGTLMKYLGSETVVSVPLGITHIKDGAFEGSEVVSVELPEGVVSIGRYAFRNCRHLVSVVLPQSVETLGEDAFRDCLSLESISLPSNAYVFKNAFKGCRMLYDEYEVMYIGDTVVGCYENAFDTPHKRLREGTRRITESAFEDVHGLKTIYLPSGLECIGRRAFYRCDELTEIEMPSSVVRMLDMTFCHCTSLKAVRLPDGLAEIGDYMFGYCESLEALELPSGVTSICDNAFIGCRSLVHLELPAGVAEIGNAAFAACSALVELELPLGVTVIGIDAFSDCTALRRLTIPSIVESVGTRAFQNCSALEHLELPCIEFIQQRICCGCTSLKAVEIPYGVSTVRYGAFLGCKSLEAVIIPQSVDRLDFDVFDGCDAVSDIYFDGTKAKWNDLGDRALPKGCTVHCSDAVVIL